MPRHIQSRSSCPLLVGRVVEGRLGGPVVPDHSIGRIQKARASSGHQGRTIDLHQTVHEDWSIRVGWQLLGFASQSVH